MRESSQSARFIAVESVRSAGGGVGGGGVGAVSAAGGRTAVGVVASIGRGAVAATGCGTAAATGGRGATAAAAVHCATRSELSTGVDGGTTAGAALLPPRRSGGAVRRAYSSTTFSASGVSPRRSIKKASTEPDASADLPEPGASKPKYFDTAVSIHAASCSSFSIRFTL